MGREEEVGRLVLGLTQGLPAEGLTFEGELVVSSSNSIGPTDRGIREWVKGRFHISAILDEKEKTKGYRINSVTTRYSRVVVGATVPPVVGHDGLSERGKAATFLKIAKENDREVRLYL